MPINLAPILGSRIGGTGTPGSKSLAKTAAAIAKGDVVAKGSGGDAQKWLKAATTSTGPFAVCIETAAVTVTTSFSAIKDGEVLLTAGDAINAGAYVMRSGAVAGQVVAYDGADPDTIVGVYQRHEGEDAGDQTAAADGDIIVVDLGKGATGVPAIPPPSP